MLRRRSDCLKSKATGLKVTKERMNHLHEQISQIRSVKEQTKGSAVKIQQHRSKSWTKPESHPKAMCMAVGAGSPENEEKARDNRRLGKREAAEHADKARQRAPPRRSVQCTLSVNTKFRCCDTVDACVHTVTSSPGLKQRCACLFRGSTNSIILSQS